MQIGVILQREQTRTASWSLNSAGDLLFWGELANYTPNCIEFLEFEKAVSKKTLALERQNGMWNETTIYCMSMTKQKESKYDDKDENIYLLFIGSQPLDKNLIVPRSIWCSAKSESERGKTMGVSSSLDLDILQMKGDRKRAKDTTRNTPSSHFNQSDDNTKTYM